ncbi:MAG: hypothetical protein IPP44_01500 [Ideonella sp.]|nr:hypothetical protein [Ideonella sp.]
MPPPIGVSAGHEIEALMGFAMDGKAYRSNCEKVRAKPGKRWRQIEGVKGAVYSWPSSTYIAEPPFFDDFKPAPAPLVPGVKGARIKGLFGDSITTDHISPAGSFAENTPAGQYLLHRGVAKADCNSHGARRGHHEVMLRGTFANVRIKNLMLPALANGSRFEGGFTRIGAVQMPIYDAATQCHRTHRIGWLRAAVLGLSEAMGAQPKQLPGQLWVVGVAPLMPDALAIAVQQDRHDGGTGEVVRIRVHLDLDPVGQVAARSVDQDMPVGDQVQTIVTLKEEAGRSGEQLRAEERRHAGSGQQQRLDQGRQRLLPPRISSATPATMAPAPAQAGTLTVCFSLTDISIGPNFTSWVCLV